MDPELDVAGVFVLKKVKSEPWREVAGEHLKKRDIFPKKATVATNLCLFEKGKTEENWIPLCR